MEERGTRNAERETRNRCASFCSAFRLPHSALAVKHRRLVGRSGRRKSEMPVRGTRGAAAARRAGQEPLLHQERLAPFPPPARALPPRGGEGGEAHPAAPQLLAEGLEE